jgi:uncharacterized protein (TIGR00255 family)
MRHLHPVPVEGETIAMIRSMTGYGRRQASWAGGTVTVELRSVNHRFCEIAMRLPRGMASLEDGLKELIQRRCTRGRIDLAVSLTGGRETRRTVTLDRQLAKQYHRLLDQLRREFHLAGSIDLALLAGLRDLLVVTEEPVSDKALQVLIKRLTAGAATDLDRMRQREGKALAAHLNGLLASIEKELAQVAARVPQAVQEHYDRMKGRIEKLLDPGRADAGRLEQELAAFADRSDISEEQTRLQSHLRQFRDTMKSQDSIGKTLDFLLQEMGRETNTIGSKANDAGIAGHVVRIKGELEKLREQVLNIQ